MDKAHYFKGVEYLIRAIPLLSLRGSVFAKRSNPVLIAIEHEIAEPAPSIPEGVAVTLPRNETCKVVIVGKGELIESYKKLTQELDVWDKVIFAGGVSDQKLVKLYQMAYVTVLPSIDQSEAFGIVLVESMACGTPVIASDLPGVGSVFEDGVTGFVSRVKDEEDIAEKMSFILNNPEKRKQMSGDCVKLVADKYNWDKIGDALLKLVVGN